MPELPEVESIRMYLEAQLVGKTLTHIEIIETRMFIGGSTKVTGKKISEVIRNGKILSFKFNNNLYLSTHLKLSGQILFAQNKDHPVFKNNIPRANTNTMPGKTTRIILYFDDNSALYFNDMRKFGWMKIGDRPEKSKGIDVLSKKFTKRYFEQSISKTTRPIKIVLMDQEKMSGIGNIYVNDALFVAKIHPARKSNSLTTVESQQLYKAILEVIHEGIKHKGSSAKDELYLLPDSEKGGYQNHFKTYHQHGKPCPTCGTIIMRIKLGGRGTFFCPTCQK